MMNNNKIIIYIALILIALGSGCKVGKNYQRPEVALPKQFGATSYADTSSIADLEWKKFFTDITLQNLIDRGIKYNYDLQIALKRIEIAGEQVKQAKQLQLPQLNLQVSLQYDRFSNNSINRLRTVGLSGGNHINDFNADIGLTWEADIWGKIRRKKEMVLAQYLQTYEATKAVQTKLVSDIAQGYYNLLMLDKQLDITRKNLRLADTTAQLTRLLKDAGDASLLAVQQADAQERATALLIPQFEQSIALQENALQILTGNLPQSLARHTTIDDFHAPAGISTGLPAAMLSRRPDVRSDEMALIAANAQVGVAQGNMYPALSINAQSGAESLKTSNWFTVPASLFGMVTGAVLQPVFNHRSLKTQYEVAKFQREIAVLQFRASVLNAVGEVSNALVQHEQLQKQQEIAAGQVDTLHNAIKNAQLLFRNNNASYLEVIAVQGSALQAELNLASIQRRRDGAIVELYRSLGGGWK